MPGRIHLTNATDLAPEETDLRKITDAITHTQSHAFSPFTVSAYGTTSDTINANAFADITGLSVDVVVPVPCLARIWAVLQVDCSGLTAGSYFQSQITRDGSAITSSRSVWEPTAVNARCPVVLMYYDSALLLPRKTITYAIQARADGGTSTYIVTGTRSTLIVTLEPRARATT